MTYEGQPTRAGTAVLKVLVIVTIIWVAYWAATGGLDLIAIPETSSITSTTLAG